MTRTTRRITVVLLTLATIGLTTTQATAEQAGSKTRSFQAGLIDGGALNTCAVTTARTVRCWGANTAGQLGYADTVGIGDDEPASARGNIDVGGPVRAITAGGLFVCALLEAGTVRCWGTGNNGRLGYGNIDKIGDDEAPSAAGDVPLGGTVTAISSGNAHTCVVLSSADVRCWGSGTSGQLGAGNTNTVGANEPADAVGVVPLGGKATAVAAGRDHSCAILTTGAVRCWGANPDGRLGYGSTSSIGDNEPASAAGDVPLGGQATALAAGDRHTCALLASGTVRCWGDAVLGQLGYGNTDDVGDDEPASAAGDVPLGGAAVGIAAGRDHTCALMTTGAVRCWGAGALGPLGYASVENIGDDEPASAAGNVTVGAPVTAVTAGSAHTCATLTTGAVRCWGFGEDGRLGYGNTATIGDDEPVAAAGDVPLGASLRGLVTDVSVAVAAPSSATTGVPYAATVSVINAGPDAATGLTVSAPGLAGTASRGAYDPAAGVWTVGTLAVGQSATLTLTRRGDAAGPQSLVAEVQAAGVFDLDSTPGNGLAEEDDRATASTAIADPPPVVTPPVVTPPVVVEQPKPVVAPTRVRGKLSVTARLRPRARKARISGKLVLPVGTSRTLCSGSVKVSLLRGTRAIATGTAMLKRPARGRTCTFAKTVTLKKKARLARRQKLKVSARVVQNSRLQRVVKRTTKTVPRR